MSNLTGTTWTFHDTIDVSTALSMTCSTGPTLFTSGLINGLTLKVESATLKYTSSLSTTNIYNSNTWSGLPYKTVTFLREPVFTPDETTCLNWLNTNATQQTITNYYFVTQNDLDSIANAVRARTGANSILEFPNGLVNEINTIPTTDDATAIASHIFEGETAYVNYQKITGTYVPGAMMSYDNTEGIDIWSTSNQYVNAGSTLTLSISPNGTQFSGKSYNVPVIDSDNNKLFIPILTPSSNSSVTLQAAWSSASGGTYSDLGSAMTTSNVRIVIQPSITSSKISYNFMAYALGNVTASITRTASSAGYMKLYLKNSIILQKYYLT